MITYKLSSRHHWLLKIRRRHHWTISVTKQEISLSSSFSSGASFSFIQGRGRKKATGKQESMNVSFLPSHERYIYDVLPMIYERTRVTRYSVHPRESLSLIRYIFKRFLNESLVFHLILISCWIRIILYIYIYIHIYIVVIEEELFGQEWIRKMKSKDTMGKLITWVFLSSCSSSYSYLDLDYCWAIGIASNIHDLCIVLRKRIKE